MALFLIALLAGVLTVLSPCVLPLLPIIVGGSLAGGTSIRRIFTVTLSLGVSVFLFTLILKVSTAFINVPAWFWTAFSGTLIIIIGLIMLFPQLWDKLSFLNKMNLSSNKAMSAGFKKQTFVGDIVVGASLGPVFATCSPTYFIVLATVLPASLTAGIADILAYIVGLCFSLIIVSFVGQKIMDKLGVASDPNGWFKRGIGILFLLVGIAIITGFDKVIEQPLYNIFDETKIETSLLQKDVPAPAANHADTGTSSAMVGGEGTATTTVGATGQTVAPATAQVLARKASMYKLAPELVSPDAYLNTGGQKITLARYRGKNVVLVDFWTYSCINCLRTLPYLTSWYSKYKDEGLVIIGVHTPEFAFEHVESNVAAALLKLGVTYPVVLDNEYKTWDAYGNQFWPHEYVIDVDGYITHDHIGEGDYDVTEKAIQAALAERASRLGTSTAGINQAVTTVTQDNPNLAQSPETYFGSNRNEYFGNGTPATQGTKTYTLPTGALTPNLFYLGGSWNIVPEYATSNASDDTIEYMYSANDIYIVASASTPVQIEVLQDGKPVGSAAGADVSPTTSTATIQANRLYSLVHNATPGQHTIEIKVMDAGFNAYTFTFG